MSNPARTKQYPWTLLAQPARAGALGRTYRRPVLCTPLCKSGRVASPIPPHPLYPGHSPTISLTGALPDFWYQLRLVLGLFRRPTERDNGGTIRVWMVGAWDAWGQCNAVLDFWRSASAFGTRTTSPPHCLGEGRLGAEHLFQTCKALLLANPLGVRKIPSLGNVLTLLCRARGALVLFASKHRAHKYV